MTYLYICASISLLTTLLDLASVTYFVRTAVAWHELALSPLMLSFLYSFDSISLVELFHSFLQRHFTPCRSYLIRLLLFPSCFCRIIVSIARKHQRTIMKLPLVVLAIFALNTNVDAAGFKLMPRLFGHFLSSKAGRYTSVIAFGASSPRTV